MFIDHIGVFFFPEQQIFRAIGRIAFPTFLFLIGYSGKFINKRDIIILAIIMISLDYALIASEKSQINLLYGNILPTIIISRLIYKHIQKWVLANLLKTFLVLCVYHLSTQFFIQYGVFGIAFIICGDLAKRQFKDQHSLIFFILSLTSYATSQTLNYNWNASILALLLLGLVSMHMLKFKIYDVEIKNKFLSLVTSICSRYSLYVYCVHFQIFKIISLYAL